MGTQVDTFCPALTGPLGGRGVQTTLGGATVLHPGVPVTNRILDSAALQLFISCFMCSQLMCSE